MRHALPNGSAAASLQPRMQDRHVLPHSPDSRLLAALAVLRVAAVLEPDPIEAMVWYRKVPIALLDGLTAAELVIRGRAPAVLMFLRSAIEIDLIEKRRLQ